MSSNKIELALKVLREEMLFLEKEGKSDTLRYEKLSDDYQSLAMMLVEENIFKED